MRKKIIFFSLSVIAGVMLFTSCNRNPHFITDKEYRDAVHASFTSRSALIEQALGDDFTAFDTMSHMEREALEFLYAYMPLSDLADYDLDFFRRQVATAFEARDSMSWGKSVPEDIFRHFVLVYRVNNENLDTARMYIYHLLKERVNGMTMEEAALEINHWCHEHVAYRAADSRTSSPLATMRTSLGRCGEESTFTVTAMRAMGIPARQCYTPRWAHCDDNHAWVEVWVDGQWKYLGACEPDPRLDMGWFSIPSTRCMMVHTKAFGLYKGNEEVVVQSDLYSELNLLANYAPTKKVCITVYDMNDQPVPEASVKFKLYNYSEYYTLANVTCNENGQACLTTGLGDLLIWATDGTHYNYKKIDVRQHDTMSIWLSREGDQEYVDEMNIIPPYPGEAKVIPTDDEVACNAKRLAYEDSVRTAYMATFPTAENYTKWLQPNTALTPEQQWDIIHTSEGNYAEISTFLNNHTTSVDNLFLYDYLKSYSDKDMRDIQAQVLESHITLYDGTIPLDVYKKGIMPARISNELVTSWRGVLGKQLQKKGVGANVSAKELAAWTIEHIDNSSDANYFRCPMSPCGVLKLGVSDPHSCNIFYVAACRDMNIPAYLDNATNTIYAWSEDNWVAIDLQSDSKTPAESIQETAQLILTYSGKEPVQPIYYPHYTIQKYENGDFVTLDFDGDPRVASFPITLDIEPGYYCLSTGNRYTDGEVLSRMEFFEIQPGSKMKKEIVILPLVTRLSETDSSQLARIDKNQDLWDGVSLADYAGESGFLYINIGDYTEPSKHLVQELIAKQSEMKQWGGMTFMVGPQNVDMMSWNLVNTDISFHKSDLEQRLLDAIDIELNNNYPFVVLVDKDGVIRYHSEGYKIGSVEQILKATRK